MRSDDRHGLRPTSAGLCEPEVSPEGVKEYLDASLMKQIYSAVPAGLPLCCHRWPLAPMVQHASGAF